MSRHPTNFSLWRRYAASIALAALLLAPAARSHGYDAGPIRIQHPFSPATPAGATTGAVYMTIVNASDAPVRLLGASTPAAVKVEFHSMSLEGGVMKMRRAEDLVVPPRGKLVMRPGVLHLMLVGLKGPLLEEDLVALKLKFEGGIDVDLELYVEQRAPAARHGH
jgi:periplasmic copper chaperone A